MRARHAYPDPALTGSTNPTSSPPPSVVVSLNRIADGIDRLITVIETRRDTGLGGAAEPRYTRPPEETDMVDEKAMARILNIPRRTLAYHRDQQRLPGCWIKNGRRILWHVHATREAWMRGIG
jgi:hypothetical protein